MVYITVTAVLSRGEWAGHVVLMGKTRNAHTILVGKHEGSTGEVSITEVDLKELEYEDSFG